MVQITTDTAEPGPQSTCGFYEDQLPVWDMLGTLMDGTNAMRKAGQKYLPKFQYETPSGYEFRLLSTTLLNYYKRSVMGLLGKPFSEPLGIPENMDEGLKNILADDVDHQGSDLDAFARNAFHIGLSKGLVHILVDYPTAMTSEDGAPVTLADEEARGATPYMVIIQPENLIAAFAEFRHGVEVLTHIRIKECEVVQDKWKEIEIERVRILEPGKWELWRKGDNGKYTLESEGTTSLDYIPLVTYYAERQGFMRSRPPLLDLAHLNVSHWQSSSDQRNALSVARFPILAASGVDPETQLMIGPNTFYATREPTSKIYYVENSGSALGMGRQDLEDLKTEMAMMGLQLLLPGQPGGQTATAKAMDGAEANCGLQAMVLDFQACLNQAVDIMADWLGIETGEKKDAADSILINSEFGLALGQAQDLSILLAMRASRELSHAAFMTELKRRGFLPADFDIEADLALVGEEAPTVEEAGAGFPAKKQDPEKKVPEKKDSKVA